jgi:hypothetical protein
LEVLRSPEGHLDFQHHTHTHYILGCASRLRRAFVQPFLSFPHSVRLDSGGLPADIVRSRVKHTAPLLRPDSCLFIESRSSEPTGRGGLGFGISLPHLKLGPRTTANGCTNQLGKSAMALQAVSAQEFSWLGELCPWSTACGVSQCLRWVSRTVPWRNLSEEMDMVRRYHLWINPTTGFAALLQMPMTGNPPPTFWDPGYVASQAVPGATSRPTPSCYAPGCASDITLAGLRSAPGWT